MEGCEYLFDNRKNRLLTKTLEQNGHQTPAFLYQRKPKVCKGTHVGPFRRFLLFSLLLTT
jgi:hypothetical protein